MTFFYCFHLPVIYDISVDSEIYFVYTFDIVILIFLEVFVAWSSVPNWEKFILKFVKNIDDVICNVFIYAFFRCFYNLEYMTLEFYVFLVIVVNN